MTIYLYVKTHNKTGLKYLGKTERDPYKYRGSGTYWKLHLKQHGNDVTTEIIRECQTDEELKKWGLYYSNIWNIVESEQWANLMEEKGDGVSGEQAKKIWEDNEHQKIISQCIINQWKDPEFRKKQKDKRNDIQYIQNQSEKAKQRWNDPELRKIQQEKTTGKNSPRYDHRIYHFVHESGIKEICTKYELYTKYSLDASKIIAVANSTRKSHKGWRIVKE